MVLVDMSAKKELVSKLTAETTTTALLMKSVPTKIKCATQSHAKVTLCAKKKPSPVKLIPKIAPQVNANVSTTNAKSSTAELTIIVMLKVATSVTQKRTLQPKTHVSRSTASVTTCVTTIPDQNVKTVNADVTNSNVSQSHAVIILTVMMVKSVLVNVSITQTSMVLTSSTVKNQTPASKLIAKVTTIVAKKNDAIHTNVSQFNVPMNLTVVNR